MAHELWPRVKISHVIPQLIKYHQKGKRRKNSFINEISIEEFSDVPLAKNGDEREMSSNALSHSTIKGVKTKKVATFAIITTQSLLTFIRDFSFFFPFQREAEMIKQKGLEKDSIQHLLLSRATISMQCVSVLCRMEIETKFNVSCRKL